MDLTCLCLVSVRARIWGAGCALSRVLRFRIVVSIPLVLRVMAVILGCR
jgi:hypothetical protein